MTLDCIYVCTILVLPELDVPFRMMMVPLRVEEHITHWSAYGP